MYASNGSICLLGDLNSRTSSDIELIENDKLSKETNDVISSFLEYDSDFDRTLPLRHSEDSVKNSHGSKLLKLCQSAGLFIVMEDHKAIQLEAIRFTIAEVRALLTIVWSAKMLGIMFVIFMLTHSMNFQIMHLLF